MAASVSLRPPRLVYEAGAPSDCSVARRSRAGGAGRRQSADPMRDQAAGHSERHPRLGKHAKQHSVAGQPPRVTAGGDWTEDPEEAALAIAVRRSVARRQRWTARARLSGFTGLRRVAACGRVPLTDDGAVYLRARTGDDCKAGFGGLQTCGSVWACPVCSAKVSVVRIAELDKLLQWNAERGGSVAMATFTLRHNKGQRLKTVWDALSGAWTYMTQGRAAHDGPWRRLRVIELNGDGYVRATEVTYGDNGWHVHIHLMMLFDQEIDAMTAECLADQLYKPWALGLEKHGFTASREHGVDVRVCTGTKQSLEMLSDYFNKMSYEAAGGRFKQGRKGGRTPFEILADGLDTGNADDLELWLEWEAASKGRRQLLWSRGLKKRVGIDELDDEEIAAQKDEGETLLVLPRLSWQQVWPIAVELLEATESGGIAGAMLWLDDRGVNYEIQGTSPCVGGGGPPDGRGS